MSDNDDEGGGAVKCDKCEGTGKFGSGDCDNCGGRGYRMTIPGKPSKRRFDRPTRKRPERK
jgi:RecJ-like exonuclease